MSSAYSYTSNEEKKALILRVVHDLFAELCSKAGTQQPLLFIHPNEDGTGALTEIWESEAAWLKTASLMVDPTGTKTSSMTYYDQKLFVLNAVGNFHTENPGANYMVYDEGISPRTAKVVLSYPTYQQLLDAMYRQAKGRQQQQQQQQQQYQASAAAPFSHHKDPVQEVLDIGLASGQLTGALPTHYVNGVPHYRGLFNSSPL